MSTMRELDLKKVELIQASLKGKSQGVLAQEFKISKSQVQRILVNKDSILARYRENAPASSYRCPSDRGHAEIDELTISWFRSVRNKNIPVSGPLIQEKALFFAKALEITDFKASNGWLAKFKARHQITGGKISGESASVSEETVNDWKLRLPEITKGYERRNIFNCDESGLFYRALPDKTLRFKGTDCKGGKVAKERLTVFFCCNMDGEFEKPVVIGKFANPRCFKRLNQMSLPVTYVSNRKAWMTTSIFFSWLKKFNEKMRIQDRRVILFMDNATCHTRLDLSNVVVSFFPPNTTAKLQPLDQGIIRSIKSHYRRLLLQSVLAKIDQMENVDAVKKSVTVLDSVYWIAKATTQVTERTVQSCFGKCGFCEGDDSGHDTPADDFDGSLSELVIHLQSAMKSTDVVGDYLHCDDDLPTACDEASVEQELINDHMIIQSDPIESEDEEDDDLIPQESISTKEAFECIDKLKHYLSSKDMSDAMAPPYAIHNAITQCTTSKCKQSTLDSFVVKSSN